MIIYAMAPLYIWYADTLRDFEFDVERIYGIWGTTTAFLLLYVVHHFVLVPKLFIKKRYAAYAMALVFCMTAFTLKQMHNAPRPFVHKERMDMQHDARRERMRAGQHPMSGEPHRFLSPPDVACLIMGMLMLGADIGMVAWMNSKKLHRQLMMLEQQSLRQELEHLRYQINPHFFMNTLNNIHVLIDVDQERAKQAIIELSGLMRHSLYNGHESMTPLQNEIEFLRQYISLMKLRFGKRVTVDAYLPDAPSHDIMIPPLLYATFVENAFKHGISYRKPSFINVRLAADTESNEIRFRCENSRWESSVTPDGFHGIGLNNVRKRLELQYAEDYTLNIDDEKKGLFVVSLILPTMPPKKQ